MMKYVCTCISCGSDMFQGENGKYYISDEMDLTLTTENAWCTLKLKTPNNEAYFGDICPTCANKDVTDFISIVKYRNVPERCMTIRV